jgi:hypothetical protein
MKTKLLIASLLCLLSNVSAYASPQLPNCQDEGTNQRARYAFGVAFGAGIAAEADQFKESELPNSEICSYVGSAVSDLAAYMSLVKVTNSGVTLDQATRLMQAQALSNTILGFCNPIPQNGIAPSIAMGDRSAVAKIGKSLKDVSTQILIQDVGCLPNRQ